MGLEDVPLKVEIKPGERLILGNAVITNDGPRARLHVEGDAPILREKDILRPDAADTPCKRIYLMVQMMYLAANPKQHFELYFALVQDVRQAAPSTAPRLDRINRHLLGAHYYKALKEAKALIAYEKELMQHARGC